MESEALLPPAVVKTKISQRQRKHWIPRFILLAILGSTLVIWNIVTGLMIKKGYAFTYVVHGRLPLMLSVAESESEFLKVLDETNYARNWSKIYTLEPHLSGQNDGLVEFTKEKFAEYGLVDTKVETYYVYLNTPEDHALRLVKDGKVLYSASLEEDALPEDPTSQNNTIPTFHGYSASGNVTAAYFYANYGRKEDFLALARAKIDMAGKIAIVRYGEIYRGLKVKFAQENGAVGVVMYSDPGDDGEFIPQNGYKQYPHGPARNEASVQRGSVMYLSYGPGDPTTPGYALKKDAPRTDPHATTPKIPSLPVSYRDVKPILEKLNGKGIKGSSLGKDWVGKLEGYDYSVGLSAKEEYDIPSLNLFNAQNYSTVPIHNVLGTTKGILENEVIVIGNHRDAWITGGAGDPNSGSAAMLEILRSFKNLQDLGWKPYRTILWASWDGEEPGLLGLTEWAEDHAKWIGSKVVAYLNIDSAVTGNTLALQSSPVLNQVLKDAAKVLPYPKGGTLFEHFQNGPLKGEIPILGSGSDYTVFLEHLGVPSFDIGFACNPMTDPIYQYHLNYDSFYWMETFTDPGFVYHNLMSKYLGIIALRLSGSEVIQFNVEDYASAIQGYFDDALKAVPPKWYHHKSQSFGEYQVTLPSQLKSYNSEVTRDSTRLVDGHFQHIDDFSEAVAVTKKAMTKFVDSARKFDQYKKDLQCQIKDSTKFNMWKRFGIYSRLQLVNLKLALLERIFLFDEGLNDRPWFKHSIYASGRYTGYAGQSLPGFREAIEDLEVEDAVKWLNVYWISVYALGALLRVQI